MEPERDRCPAERVNSFGPFVLDRAGGRLWRGRKAIALRPKAWRVLAHLADHPGTLVAIQELLDVAWPDAAVTPQTLTNVIGEIRAALGDTAARPRWIETVHGRGYRFRARTRTLATFAGAATPVSGSGAPPASIFVGRAAERARLLAAWERARAGERQLAFVTGDAGIGKTTLAEAVLRAAAPEDARDVLVARGASVEQHGDREPYMPILLAIDELARGRFGRSVQAELRRYAPTWQLQLPWLVRGTEREQVERSLQGATAVRMLREGAAFLEALARRRAVLVLLDDLHWSDAATIEFVTTLAERTTPARLMVIATYRGADAALAGHAVTGAAHQLCVRGRAVEVALGPLECAAVEAYLAARLEDTAIAAALAARVEGQASGNPLFVRSVVEHLVEAGALTRRDGVWQLAADTAAHALVLPDALREMVMAQLTRLEAPTRALVEAASVAGSDFTTRELAGALGRPEAEVDATCDVLAGAGRLLRRLGTTTWPDGARSARYGFVHAVYQRLVHEGIPALRGQALHHQVGSALETAWGARAREIAARLASHFERAADAAKTVEYLALAASNAARRLAYVQGVEYVRSAIATLASLPADAARAEREATLQRRLGSMLAMAEGMAAATTGAAFARAWALADGLGAEPGRVLASAGLAIHHVTAARYREAEPHVERLLAVGRAAAPGLVPLACCYAAYVRSAAGDLAGAAALLDEGARAETDGRIPGFMDARRMILSQQALVLTHLGALGRARRLRDEALARSRAHGTPADLAHAAVFAAEAAALERDPAAGRAAAALATTLAEENGLPSYRALGRFYGAWFGTDAERVGAMEAVLTERRRVGDRWQESVLLALLADAKRAAHDVDGALAVLDEAVAFTAAVGERHFEAELHRIRGRSLADRAGDPAAPEAERCYRAALETAQHTGAALWELRAATALATALADGPRRPEGRAALAAAHARMAGEASAPDVREAGAVLERVSGGWDR